MKMSSVKIGVVRSGMTVIVGIEVDDATDAVKVHMLWAVC
jgi:hypothetical protein